MRLKSPLRNHLWSTVVFLLVCLAGFGARQGIGTIYSSAKATELIEALSRAGLYLGSAIVTASVTTLALMLTLIGMLRRMDKDFDQQTYRNVDLIARLATASLMIALFVLLAFTLPVGEFDELPEDWFIRLYDALFAASVVMVGLNAATVTVLYRTLRGVLSKITPGDEV
ncbi:hypothetical protein GRI62_07680 [Erythrobacter arachoides]|uniref:Uncharacterized protein n=1 Tax=Aurantiacibacter arachoides TaxID=1850444 RepID=A0A844ZZ78_9SPHN|nr:hypothetical protein [Aurantiacibacter arachoides]MXO93483.1 hypothetical protein [Aurantiacibacter arachoides]GGD49041.1 hypothetical protein GCM10011411_05990 [Aurantiacibacter arachoides]